MNVNDRMSRYPLPKPSQQVDDEDDGDQREEDQHIGTQGPAVAGQQPERGAGVADVGQIHPALDDGNRVMQRNVVVNEQLGALVEQQDRGQQKDYACAFSACGKDRNTSAQRGQTPGQAACDPTPGLYFQHRSHFPPSAAYTPMAPPSRMLA